MNSYETTHVHKVLAIVVLLLFSFSCASDLDFDQANDLKLEPIVVANLAYFNVEAKDFAGSGSGQIMFNEQTTTDIFNESFFKRRIKKVELLFELENTINRVYVVDLFFLDRNGQEIYKTNLNVRSYAGAVNKIDKTEVFDGINLELLKHTTTIVFSVRMLAGTPLSSNSPGSLKFRSGVTAYIVVE